MPTHYVLSRSFTDIDKLSRVFEITPILGCIVTEARDSELALKINPQIILSTDPENAAAYLFTEYGFPSVIIREAEGLQAVYADGRREEIAI